MAVLTPITDTVIQDSILRAVQSVSRTMLQWDVTLRQSATEPNPATTYQLIGNVGFAGVANGIVYLCMSEDFAAHATGKMLGMSPGEVAMNGPEIVKDALGEITNMTVGGFKNQLCDIGFPCMLTLPTILRGVNLHVAAIKAANRHVFEFECQGHKLVADIQLKTD
jgi:chemotaxis protein CheX